MSQRLDAFSSQPWWQEIGHDATADILKESVMDFSSDRNIWFGSKIINSEKTAALEEAGAQKLTGIGVILPQGKSSKPKVLLHICKIVRLNHRWNLPTGQPFDHVIAGSL